METVLATIIPALIVSLLGIIIYLTYKKLSNWFWRILRWMVINGYYFPSIMRKLRDENIASIEKKNAEYDKIINGRT